MIRKHEKQTQGSGSESCKGSGLCVEGDEKEKTHYLHLMPMTFCNQVPSSFLYCKKCLLKVIKGTQCRIDIHSIFDDLCIICKSKKKIVKFIC